MTLPDGAYYATIEKAEMRTPKDDNSKPDYLSLTLALRTKNNINKGKIFDALTESDKDLTRYKLGRFIRAVGLEQTFQQAGTFRLRDLQKLVTGKQVIVDVATQKAQNGYAAKNQVDALNREIYYLPSETDAFTANKDEIPSLASNNAPPEPTPPPVADDIPFNDTY
jgi:hypothetical protein